MHSPHIQSPSVLSDKTLLLRTASLDIQMFSSEMFGLTIFFDLKYRIQKKNVNIFLIVMIMNYVKRSLLHLIMLIMLKHSN
jgi:hypothetical protein